MTFKCIDGIDEAFAYVKAEFATLEKKLADLSEKYPPVKEFKSYDEALKPARIFQNKPNAHKLFQYGNPAEVFAKYKAVYDSVLAEVAKIDAENAAIAENNKKAWDAVAEVMRYYGIGDHYYEVDPKSRAWPKKKVKVDAGWVRDLRREGPKTFRPEGTSTLKYWLQYLEDAYKEAIAKEADKKREQEMAQKEKDRKVFWIEMIKKYDMPADTLEDDILWRLLDRNKYLRLAHYFLMNRNDWNDGSYYAETGIEKFKVESDLDKEIVEDLEQHIGDGWDFDGRCFRDTKWGYDALFSLVEKQDKDLLEDYNKAYAYGGYRD